MKQLHALALSIAVLVAVWVYVSIGLPDLKFSPWIGFVAWAAFFAAGGGKGGARHSLGAGLAGVLLTALTMAGVQQAGGDLTALLLLLLLVPVLAFVLVAMAQMPLLAYTPAAFLGAAAFFGSGGKPDLSIAFVSLTWIAGVLLGYASEWLGARLTQRTAAQP
ncbi:DUF1097 family protein [Verminephrobacter eiseniae]|uniref:Glutathione-regulated potassium-efflux system protein n=1 Tax=Verminephrobacter eiseniae (strain EF01-2) TaxID=391735 RepID=A1WSM8_VEREI|nr:DUF1097 family protein [Verminephrobacter eiseniae]ABM60635.1 glutathione-regulated potassium-efflux system protein [Verminephrobacter eiseniae EF01-2]MCW5286108.1 DUF1097 domain-containing protein [Verminephrobacter eiseniae]MCW5304406.1 DUF1097 domain-containing protein [Verminephrobacter eiseniae]MCW8178394.1 DUF1097 domain-containing protein [Verminephrobacter eiseniae]MCW8189798.1 DUF1097 domain-containing protein [Verminephrobacter eiseniae]